MFKVYDNFDCLWDIDTYADLCHDCLYQNECILMMAIASDMVELNTNQPLESCKFYKQDNWFNRLVTGR